MNKKQNLYFYKVLTDEDEFFFQFVMQSVDHVRAIAIKLAWSGSVYRLVTAQVS